MTNHTEFDQAYDRARLAQLPRAAGEPHVYEKDAAAVQRYFSLMRDCAEASGDAAAYYRYYENFNPLKRIAKPEEVAESVVFVASAAAAFMTGAIIPVDGGSIAGRL